ncbi:unnamed protein product [Vitrella brassicaformis CCMP3155]|uniref:Mob1/phocein family protein n=2 Tax=Vitrella brassicaformis TaxID=1169539 RepID=A0A0G4EB98_VITBC|nr:unnamed protein product [Vitrella brassicaformis CCMP3155]|eukprot:CEL92972.1 unnamed protein product [Vitrella brassicaformis CCMP3155]
MGQTLKKGRGKRKEPQQQQQEHQQQEEGQDEDWTVVQAEGDEAQPDAQPEGPPAAAAVTDPDAPQPTEADAPQQQQPEDDAPEQKDGEDHQEGVEPAVEQKDEGTIEPADDKEVAKTQPAGRPKRKQKGLDRTGHRAPNAPLPEVALEDVKKKGLLEATTTKHLKKREWEKRPAQQPSEKSMLCSDHPGKTTFDRYYTHETLNKRQAIQDVLKCPFGSNINREENIARAIVDCREDISLTSDFLIDRCTCQTMMAGKRCEFRWFEEPDRSITAREYMNKLVEWLRTTLSQLPSDKTYPTSCKDVFGQMVRRIFYVYAHVYYEHLPDFVEIGEGGQRLSRIADLNAGFCHILGLCDMYDLFDASLIPPLREIVSIYRSSPGWIRAEPAVATDGNGSSSEPADGAAAAADRAAPANNDNEQRHSSLIAVQARSAVDVVAMMDDASTEQLIEAFTEEEDGRKKTDTVVMD